MPYLWKVQAVFDDVAAHVRRVRLFLFVSAIAEGEEEGRASQKEKTSEPKKGKGALPSWVLLALSCQLFTGPLWWCCFLFLVVMSFFPLSCGTDIIEVFRL